MDMATTTPGAVDMVTAAVMDAPQAAGTTVEADPMAVVDRTVEAGLTVADTAIDN